MEEKEVKGYVKKRYSKIAQTGESCNPSCGCILSAADVALGIGYSEEDLKSIPEASSMGLGCGNPVALAGLKEGETVLDLGSGGGIDVFLAAKKVGANGKAIGVDMTKEMIQKARDIASKHGYENVEFQLGEIENLPIEDASIDVVISNCVIDLSPDQEKVFREAYRVLKPGGRVLISDVVTEEELPKKVRNSLTVWQSAEWGHVVEKSRYLETIRKAGFKNTKIVSESTHNLEDVPEELRASAGKITSVQIEAHKS